MLRRFRKSQSGVALTEGLIVFPIMVLAISVLFEFGNMMYQWNAAAKAMQLGVRKLVVSNPVAPSFTTAFDINDTPGELINANAGITASCGAGTGVVCNANFMSRLTDGTAGSRWPGLEPFFRGFRAEDVRITYELSGLGYQGRPYGPVVTVRMELIRDNRDFPILGRLMTGLGIAFPRMTVSETTEDLTSCQPRCNTEPS
jgi:hypothetical protein